MRPRTSDHRKKGRDALQLPEDRSELLPGNAAHHRELVTFLHVVGRSTLRQGLTVPLTSQSEVLSQIPRGSAVPISILFGDRAAVGAVIRRINNRVGHLQIRYEGKKQEPLRAYLQRAFSEDAASSLLEVTEIRPWVFRFAPVPALSHRRPVLGLRQPLFAGVAQDDALPRAAIAEVSEVLATVEYEPRFGQSEYNQRIAQAFISSGWRKEFKIIDAMGLRVDFEKKGIWIEVEFGNARAYYQDYIKLLLARRYRDAGLGMLLSPTQALANMLCELGAQRAAAKRGCSGKLPSYSGMMTHEKALREFPYIEFIFSNPLVVAGLHFFAGTQTKPASAI